MQNSSDDEDNVNVNINSHAVRQRRANGAIVEDDDPLQDSLPSSGVNMTSVDTMHVLELSITLSKRKGHVHPAWLQLVQNWMKERCVSGACALERGGRQQLAPRP